MTSSADKERARRAAELAVAEKRQKARNAQANWDEDQPTVRTPKLQKAVDALDEDFRK